MHGHELIFRRSYRAYLCNNAVLQPTSFTAHAATNKLIETPFRELDGKTIKEKYGLENPRCLDNVLANPIGVNAAFRTTDGYLIVVERSDKLAQYPGLWGVPAGFMNPDKDKTPFDTASRDASIEEVGRKMAEARLLELGRALDDWHVEIIMEGIIDGTSSQVKSAPKSGEWEAKGRYLVPFDPRSCAAYLAKMIEKIPPSVPESAWITGKSPKWVPAHWRTVYLALARIHGQDEVEKELDIALKAD